VVNLATAGVEEETFNVSVEVGDGLIPTFMGR